MANAGQIADLITQGVQGPTGDQDFALVQGRIVSWDRLTGLNTVEVNGAFLTNVSALHSGVPTWFNAGDSVQLIRKQSRYFILGKVASPGGTAGSSVQFRTWAGQNTITTTGTWVDVPSSGTASLDVYVTSSRAVLILWGCDIDCNNSRGELSWQISGATTLSPGAFNNTILKNQANSGSAAQSTAIGTTVTGSYVIGPGAGLNAGLNTFTLKARVTLFGTGVNAAFGNSTLTLIPL